MSVNPTVLLTLFLPILLSRTNAASEVPGPERQPIAHGIQRVQLADPGGKWRCEGIEVDLSNPWVVVETTLANPLAGRKETVSQIAALRERSGRSVVAVAGCDEPAPNGLPDGLLIENSEIRSAPNDHASFVLTANRRALIGGFVLSASAELKSGTTFPIEQFNHLPEPGQAALLSYEFGSTPDLPEMVSIPLDLYYPFLNPSGWTLFQVGPKVETDEGIPFYSLETLPRALRSKTYRLMIPRSFYEAYRLWLQTGMTVRSRMDLGSPDFHPRVMSSLSGEPGSMYDPIVWAISGGPALLKRGQKVAPLPDEYPNIPGSLHRERLGQGGSLPAEGTYSGGKAQGGSLPTEGTYSGGKGREFLPAVGTHLSGNYQGTRISALGIDSAGQKMWVAVVTASREGFVTLSDAADALALLGAGDALALASGDHSPLWVRGDVLNPPLSQTLEVPLADALVVYTLAPEPGLGQIVVEPDDILIVPPSTEIPFKVKALDSFGHPLPLPEEAISAEVTEGNGRFEGLRYVAPKKPEDSLLRFHVRGEFGEHYSEKFIYTAVYVREPARIVVSPGLVLLEPGQSVEFRTTILDDQGDAIRIDEESIRWNLDGKFGVISPRGRLLTRSGGSGKVSARFGRLSAEAEVTVGKVTSVPMLGNREIGKWKVDCATKAGIEAAITRLDSGNGSGNGGSLLPGEGARTGGSLPAEGTYFQLTYTFGKRESGEIKFLDRVPLEGKPYGIRFWIRGDGSLNTIRCLFMDKKRRLFTVPIPEAVRQTTEWQEVVIPFAKAYPLEGDRRTKMAYPVSFEGFQVSSSSVSRTPQGSIGFGSVDVLYLDMQ